MIDAFGCLMNDWRGKNSLKLLYFQFLHYIYYHLCIILLLLLLLVTAHLLPEEEVVNLRQTSAGDLRIVGTALFEGSKLHHFHVGSLAEKVREGGLSANVSQLFYLVKIEKR